METIRQTESGIKGHDLPIPLLRLLAPPVRLLSAAMWQVVQQGLVSHYGVLEEFVTMVTDSVPELMNYRQRAQLILGLRARLVLDLCHGEHPADQKTIQTHLDRIKAPIGSPVDHHMIAQVEETEVNFVELVHTLLENTSEREHFFQEVFPMHFGSRFDTALEILLWEFISRLEELLPVPDFAQMVSWLSEAPSVLDECLQSASPPTEMKALLKHHQDLVCIKTKDPSALPIDDCILSALSLTLKARLDIKEDDLQIPINNSNFGKCKLQFPDSTIKSSGIMEEVQIRNFLPAIDSPLHDAVESSLANEKISPTWKGGRQLRKRKLSGSVEVPPKQPANAELLMGSSEDLEHPSESPLISIWGDYTDFSEGAYQVTDAKVPWSDEETLNLLDIWGKDSVQKTLKGCIKNRHIFSLISQKMSERGFVRTVEQCQTRIKRLKKCFRQCLQHNNNNGNPRLECKFYDQLEKILGKDAFSIVSKVSCDVEDVDINQPQDVEEWEFLGHTGQEAIGTRSVPWTDLETLTLINIWGEDRMQRELKGMHRNGHIFALISNKMSSQGFIRTAEQCQTRVKRLKASFRQCYENNMKEKEQVECKFYEQLEKILVNEIQGDTTTEKNLEIESSPADTPDERFSIRCDQVTDTNVGTPEERKKIPWGDGETHILLELWGDEKVQMNLKRCPHNGHIYSEISEQLTLCGYHRTAEQCHTRIKRLKTNYRQCQESMSSCGSEQADFKFYSFLEKILGGQHLPRSEVEAIEIPDDCDSNTINDTDMEGLNNYLAIEQSSRSFWSDAETLALIDVWEGEDIQKYEHNGHVYNDISEKMHNLGYSKTPEECCWKVRSIRNNFHQCFDRNKRTKVDLKFDNQMDQMLGPEAASIDTFDEADEQAHQDTETHSVLTDSSRKMPWSDRETQALLEIWGENCVQKKLRGCLKNRHVFEYISQRMTAHGFIRTAEQCHTRVKRLKAGYVHEKEEFKFYGQMEEILSREHIEDNTTTDLFHVEDSAVFDSAHELDLKNVSQMLTDGSKFPWSDSETQVLLDIWGSEDIQENLKGCTKNKHIFTQISQAMCSQGYMRTVEQCQSRVKRLKANFRLFCEGKKSGEDKVECKFYNQFLQIFGKKKLTPETLSEKSNNSTGEQKD